MALILNCILYFCIHVHQKSVLNWLTISTELVDCQTTQKNKNILKKYLQKNAYLRKMS